MSQLQKLLDEKCPIAEELMPHQKMMNEMLRKIFTEGYNAAIQEMREDAQKTVDLVNNRNKPQTNG